MPLRGQHRWDSFHSAWANTIVRHLNMRWLPARYRAEPQVSRPAQTFTVAFADEDVYEVRVYDDERGFRLVAAVELVSPRNKDRPTARLAFAGKCAGYLRQGVAVVVVDMVTERHDSLHDELMRLLGPADPREWLAVAPLYAVAYRARAEDELWRLDTWPESLAVGATLPTLPLWLSADLAVPLELEASYEETARVLRLG